MKTITINATTGERIEKDFTPEELAQYEADQAKAEAERLATEQAEKQAQAARQSALDKLAALGLSPEEVAAITGA